jgi:ubiquitin-protein ligase
MSLSRDKRLHKESADLLNTKSDIFKVKRTNETNNCEWDVTLNGPLGSPYENGKYELHVSIPNEYPFSPPNISFKTDIFHPNISTKGEICIDILGAAWSPVLTILAVISSISSLLVNPNPDDPYNPNASQMFRYEIDEYNTKVKDMVQKQLHNIDIDMLGVD